MIFAPLHPVGHVFDLILHQILRKQAVSLDVATAAPSRFIFCDLIPCFVVPREFRGYFSVPSEMLKVLLYPGSIKLESNF